MNENDTTDREKVPVADVIAGDWILTDDEDRGDPMQLLWRTGQRSPNGDMGWSFKTSAGLRHFDQDAWVYRLTTTQLPASVVNTVDDEIPLGVLELLSRRQRRGRCDRHRPACLSVRRANRRRTRGHRPCRFAEG